MADLIKEMQSTDSISPVDTSFISPNVEKQFGGGRDIALATADSLLKIGNEAFKNYLVNDMGKTLENISNSAQLEMGRANTYEEAAAATDLKTKLSKLKNVAEQRGGMDRVRIQAEAEIKKQLSRYPGMAAAFGQVSQQVLGFNPMGAALADADAQVKLQAAKAKNELAYYEKLANDYGYTTSELMNDKGAFQNFITLREGDRTITALEQRKKILGYLESDPKERQVEMRNFLASNLDTFHNAIYTGGKLFINKWTIDELKAGGHIPQDAGYDYKVTNADKAKLSGEAIDRISDNINAYEVQSRAFFNKEFGVEFEGHNEKFNQHMTYVVEGPVSSMKRFMSGEDAMNSTNNAYKFASADMLSKLPDTYRASLITAMTSLGVDPSAFKNTSFFNQFYMDVADLTKALDGRPVDSTEGGDERYTLAGLPKAALKFGDNMGKNAVDLDAVTDVHTVLRKVFEYTGDAVNPKEYEIVLSPLVEIIAGVDRYSPSAVNKLISLMNSDTDEDHKKLANILDANPDLRRPLAEGLKTYVRRSADELIKELEVIKNETVNLNVAIDYEVGDDNKVSVVYDTSARDKLTKERMKEFESKHGQWMYGMPKVESRVGKVKGLDRAVKFAEHYNNTLDLATNLGVDLPKDFAKSLLDLHAGRGGE